MIGFYEYEHEKMTQSLNSNTCQDFFFAATHGGEKKNHWTNLNHVNQVGSEQFVGNLFILFPIEVKHQRETH